MIFVLLDGLKSLDPLNPLKTYSSLTEYYTNEGYDADIPGVQVLMPEQTQKYNAVCLDGSVPDFYYRQGTGDGINKFHLYLQGGGWCATLAQCAQHTGTQLGSSKYDANYSNIAAGSPYLSSNQTTNPLTYNWNSIFIRYVCSSTFNIIIFILIHHYIIYSVMAHHMLVIMLLLPNIMQVYHCILEDGII